MCVCRVCGCESMALVDASARMKNKLSRWVCECARVKCAGNTHIQSVSINLAYFTESAISDDPEN